MKRLENGRWWYGLRKSFSLLTPYFKFQPQHQMPRHEVSVHAQSMYCLLSPESHLHVLHILPLQNHGKQKGDRRARCQCKLTMILCYSLHTEYAHMSVPGSFTTQPAKAWQDENVPRMYRSHRTLEHCGSNMPAMNLWRKQVTCLVYTIITSMTLTHILKCTTTGIRRMNTAGEDCKIPIHHHISAT